jgi:hypothetical protein
MTSSITNVHYLKIIKNIAQQCIQYKIKPENTSQTFYHTVKDVAIESAAGVC